MHNIDAHAGATGPALSLPEELLLVGLDPERGRAAVGRRYLRWGLAAATLIELEALGRVTKDGGRVVLTQATPTGNPLLDDALATLQRAPRARMRTGRWLDTYAPRAEQLTVGALAARGAVRAETHRVMGLFPVERYQVLATEQRAQRLAVFQNWAEYGPGDRRSRAFAALFKATKLARRLGVPRAVRSEMRPMVSEFWQAKAVRKKVAAAQSSGGGDGSGGDGGGGGGCGGGG